MDAAELDQSAETFEFVAAEQAADYAYRTGVYRWALPQGLWGILRTRQKISSSTVARVSEIRSDEAERRSWWRRLFGG